MKCMYCGKTMKKTNDPLPDTPNRVRHDCKKCGHVYFEIERKE